MEVNCNMELFRREMQQARAARLEGKVVLANPLSSWVLTLFLTSFALLAALWAGLTHYTRVATVPGILVPSAGQANIVAMRAGVITAVHVHENDVVTAGTPLVVVDTSWSGQGGERSSERTLAAIEQQDVLLQRRLGLERDRAGLQRARLQEMFASLEVAYQQIQGQVALQEKLVESARATFERLTAASVGVVSKLEYERTRQAQLEQQQRLLAIKQQAADNTARRAELRGQLESQGVESSDRSNELQALLSRLEQQRTAARSAATYVLLAPITGRVSALQAAAGAHAASGARLLTVVPEGAALLAELYAPSRAAGFVRPGQQVRLFYDAFPYQRFGSYRGRVDQVSNVVLMPREVLAPIVLSEPSYRIRVQLSGADVHTPAGAVPLQAGMTLTGKVLLDRRSILDLLLEPVASLRGQP